jgi:predicted RNase H-like HicB family nuclease
MTTRYELIIYWSKEDDSFVVEVPELPGCMADGKTYAEAVKNAEEIIDEWIETARKLGRPIPEPRGKLAYAWREYENLLFPI